MNEQDGNEKVITELAVIKTLMTNEFKHINDHLALLNNKTAKNTGSIQSLQSQDAAILNMVTNQGKREERQQERQESWKRSWKDLLFGTLQWIVPALIIGLLLNGKAIVDFFRL